MAKRSGMEKMDQDAPQFEQERGRLDDRIT